MERLKSHREFVAVLRHRRRVSSHDIVLHYRMRAAGERAHGNVGSDVRVGLAADGAVLASSAVTDPRAHAEQLMPLIDRTLADADRRLADVTQIVVGVGPGPFTGLRVGVVTAHTLGFVLGVPVRGVCSLDAGAADALTFAADVASADGFERAFAAATDRLGPLDALACAAANASLDLFEDGELLRRVARVEQWMTAGLSSCRDLPGVTDVRARGAIGVV